MLRDMNTRQDTRWKESWAVNLTRNGRKFYIWSNGEDIQRTQIGQRNLMRTSMKKSYWENAINGIPRPQRIGGYELSLHMSSCISNNPSFRLKHPGVPDGSDGSGGTLYPLTENQTRPVAQATGRVPYLPCGGYYTMPLILETRRVVYYARCSGVRLPLFCVRNVVTYTHHWNDTYVTLFAGVAVIQ